MKAEELVAHYDWLKQQLDAELYDELVALYESDGMTQDQAHKAVAARLQMSNRNPANSTAGLVTDINSHVR